MDVRAVIEDGLPAAPPAGEVGDDPVPVAVWREGDVAAVLVLSRDDDADEECSGWAQDVYLYQRGTAGWDLAGGGGSCWPVAYGDRPDGAEPRRTGFAFGRPGSSGERWLVTCVAPVGATEVRVHVGGSWQQPSVEPTTGAFLVEVEEPDPVLCFG